MALIEGSFGGRGKVRAFSGSGSAERSAPGPRKPREPGRMRGAANNAHRCMYVEICVYKDIDRQVYVYIYVMNILHNTV